MRIALNGVFVEDQAAALVFYRDVLGFVLKHDIPVGEFRWLTVTAAESGGDGHTRLSAAGGVGWSTPPGA